MIIEFKKIGLSEDKNTVKAVGKITYPKIYDEEIPIKLSILQLAKVWGTDRKEVSCVENEFGTIELEDKCDETREEIRNFPQVKFWGREVEFIYLSFTEKANKNLPDMKNQIVEVYAEDIVGWNNEGIRMKIPKEIFDRELKSKVLKLILTPFCVKFEEEKKLK